MLSNLAWPHFLLAWIVVVGLCSVLLLRRSRLFLITAWIMSVTLTVILLQHREWPYHYGAMILMGVVYTLTMLEHVATIKLLQFICAIPYCSPNWMSLWRIPVVAAGMAVFLTAKGDEKQLWVGFWLVDTGLTMDRVDGKEVRAAIARLRFIPEKLFNPHPFNPTMTSDGKLWAWWSEVKVAKDGTKTVTEKRVLIEDWTMMLTRQHTKIPMFKLALDGPNKVPALRLSLTGMGEWIDPGADKVNFIPFFIYSGFALFVSWLTTIPMIVLEVVSTILRAPFEKVPYLRWFHRFVRESKASFLGKIKVVCQFVMLLAVLPAAAGWLNVSELHYSWWIVSSIMGVSAFAGLLSVFSRLKAMEILLRKLGLISLYVRLQRFFAHSVQKRRERKAARLASKRNWKVAGRKNK